MSDVMTASPLSIQINESLDTAQQLMSEKNIRHLPVLKNGNPISIITDRDINLAVAANKSLQAAEEMTVEDVCVLNLYRVEKDTTLAEVVAYMAEHTIGSVVITDNDELSGIFTATDACKYLAKYLNGELIL